MGIKESEIEYLTLSDGRYDEYHGYKDFERVGSAVIDMRTRKIAYFISRDSILDEGMFELDMTTRFLTIDPLAEKYFEMSPYGYCANNPIRFIDPNGMSIDNYGVDPNTGKVEFINDTDDEYDVLYVTKTDDKGNLVRDEKGKMQIKDNATEADGQKVNDRDVLPELTKTQRSSNGYAVNFTKSDNQSEMADLFLFVANNTNVEWSLSGYKNDNGTNSFTLATFKDDGTAPNSWDTRDRIQNQTFEIHSHAIMNHVFGASTSDMKRNYAGNARTMKELGKSIFFHGVYEKENRTLYQYTDKNSMLKKRFIGNNAANLLNLNL